MAGKTIVVLGGGVGGLVASNELRKRLGREHRIVLVDRDTRHIFAPSFTWLMLGWRTPPQIIRDLSLLRKKGIEYVNAEALEIDPENKIVRTTAGDFAYNHLVIALGAEYNPHGIPGLVETTCTPYSLEGAVELRAALNGVAGTEVGTAVKRFLDERGVGFHPQHKLSSVDPGKKEIAFENGQEAAFDLLVAVPPHRSPEVVRKSPLANEAGWISVDRRTLKTGFDNVYALGDVAALWLPGRYRPATPLPLPKAGVFAHFQASTVAHNIASEIKGGNSKTE